MGDELKIEDNTHNSYKRKFIIIPVLILLLLSISGIFFYFQSSISDKGINIEEITGFWKAIKFIQESSQGMQTIDITANNPIFEFTTDRRLCVYYYNSNYYYIQNPCTYYNYAEGKLSGKGYAGMETNFSLSENKLMGEIKTNNEKRTYVFEKITKPENIINSSYVINPPSASNQQSNSLNSTTPSATFYGPFLLINFNILNDACFEKDCVNMELVNSAGHTRIDVSSAEIALVSGGTGKCSVTDISQLQSWEWQAKKTLSFVCTSSSTFQTGTEITGNIYIIYKTEGSTLSGGSSGTIKGIPI